MTADPFGTAAVRERVLDAWAASAARLREDANAEEDAALGGYRDRLVVELAQNAADAAASAGVEGRLLLHLDPDGPRGPRLLAANTGAPLDAAGVEGLATLRASAKRDDGDALVGRFGVGFSAVLSVTDDPAVIGDGGGVRFSRSATRELVRSRAASAPALGAELDRRAGHVPVLRLPFPATAEAVGGVPAGYDTVVELPLRDADAVSVATTLLEAADDVLLLALPALAEVVVELPGRERRVLRDVG
ncbi:molecular chaperone Hsp90, partial [Kineococcus sp. R8]|uniref:sacsin N-terminal ATP-binding-like domain-containing protein n=1 Tax=Kineococcus siccus TaxID=2696567 RepID=UPI001F103B58